MTPDTLTLQQIEKYWTSTRNKQNHQLPLEMIVRRYIKSILLISVINEDKLYPAEIFTDVQAEKVHVLLDLWLEKTDEWLIIQVGWAVKER